MVLREADLPPSIPLSRAVLGNLSSLAHITCAAAQTYEPAASASGSVALTRDYITRIHTINANTTANRARRALSSLSEVAPTMSIRSMRRNYPAAGSTRATSAARAIPARIAAARDPLATESMNRYRVD